MTLVCFLNELTKVSSFINGYLIKGHRLDYYVMALFRFLCMAIDKRYISES
ncbi:hypothetical protein PEC301879_23900 [Pectobacterium carotovorum subsp. carotovorum]|nr:hypothetical protein PEC301879_23900 [Pectobacterium carotovorum subsp. carotovorum]